MAKSLLLHNSAAGYEFSAVSLNIQVPLIAHWVGFNYRIIFSKKWKKKKKRLQFWETMKKHLDSTSHADIIQHNFWVPCFFPWTIPDSGGAVTQNAVIFWRDATLRCLTNASITPGWEEGSMVCVSEGWGGWLVRSHLVTQTTAGDEVDESPYSVWLTAEVGGDCDADSSWKSRRGEKKEREKEKKNNICHIASHPLTWTFVNNQ